MIFIYSGLLHIGHDNFVSKTKVIAITTAESISARRKRAKAEEENKLIDATAGRKTRSMIHLYEGYIVLSTIEPGTLNKREQEVK